MMNSLDPSIERRVYEIRGIVQGVGFRPALAKFANIESLSGSVQNRCGRVILTLEGEKSKLENFISKLPSVLTKPVRIDEIIMVSQGILEDTEGIGKNFHILESEGDDAVSAVIPPDLATCADCLREFHDSSDHRHHYPFITCVACGPRYTIVRGTPFDRAQTTMNAFPLCVDCQKEYDDQNDRRFHAETISCPACGPQLKLLDNSGLEIRDVAPITKVRRELRNGKIIAIRGIGGFHLAVDAFQPEAIRNLRERKHRNHKAFAVMARSLEDVELYCELNSQEKELLRSPRAPIVILRLKQDLASSGELPMDLIAPDADTLGVMLPYTPMHHLLFQEDVAEKPFSMLIMTSANITDEPICVENKESFERLCQIADFFLYHNREIEFRNEDSLCIACDSDFQLWRRGRGYAPEAIPSSMPFSKVILAMGPELKNTLALGFDNSIVLSPHNGDLSNLLAVRDFEKVTGALLEFYQRSPELIAVDRHPDFHSTRFGEQLAKSFDAEIIQVQHHHAHAAACMAEHGLDEALALVFDGTGLGLDDTIWGAELLHVSPDGFQRVASFAPAPLPGGDAAVLRPARQLIGRYLDAGLEIPTELLARLEVSEEELAVWQVQLDRGLNSARTHAAGRLFDAFSVLLGLPPAEITYEAQAAILLETAARRFKGSVNPSDLPFELKQDGGVTLIDWAPLFSKFIEHPVTDVDKLAMTFHEALADAAVKMLESANFATRDIVLSGGVFMNRILQEIIPKRLRKLGFQVHQHRLVPPNDGGVALGQIHIARGKSE